MDYEDVAAAYLQPLPGSADVAVPPPTQMTSTARRLRDAIEPIAMHSVWCRGTNEELASRGLDFFTSYVWGRASLLGEPEPGVVTAAFAVFEPSMVEGVYEAGRATLDRSTLIETRTNATIASLASVLVAVSDEHIGRVGAALRAAVESADRSGRPLFSGLAGQAWPDSAVGTLWRSCELLREHRGDGHVAACVSAGLDPVEMNVLTELWVGMPLGSYTGTRGWSDERVTAAAAGLQARGLVDEASGNATLTPAGLDLRLGIEHATDRSQQAVVGTLGDGAEECIARLAEWSAMCVVAAAFPSDPSKRAAG